MNTEIIPIWLAILTQLALGLGVFRANYKSYTNQSFFLISVFICGWLVSLQFAYNALIAGEAELWIRNASAAGVLVVNGFNLLRLAILYREAGWREIAKRCGVLALPSIVIILLCYTHWFMRFAELRRGGGTDGLIPQPTYGALYPIFLAFLLGGAVYVILSFLRGAVQTTGVRRVEMQFAVAGAVVLILFTLIGIALQPFLPRSIAVRLAPFRALVFTLIIAYGIATRKIMDVGTFVRRLVSYLLLLSYLVAIYLGIWWTTTYLLPSNQQHNIWPHLLATLAVALSMAPARGVSKNFADKLFVNSSGLDFRATVSKAAGILSSVTTLNDLLDRFAATITEAIGTDRVEILLLERDVFVQNYARGSTLQDRLPFVLETSDPLTQYLEKNRGPLVYDELHRVIQTAEIGGVLRRLQELRLAAAVGIFAREHLSAILLLGPRLSGRIYGSVEQNALQVLCGQLAVAIENAQLFTEVQNARIYNETLLENLTTGVIAAGANERITVFNNEAGQITGLNARDIIDQPLNNLPEGLDEVLRKTLRTGDGQERAEISLSCGERNIVARASSSIFHDENGQMLGALVVLTDITALKRLELQIRRSDRLASLGTLSAGMAHEIKNPLVSIKTFTQLLPERYQDSEFRETFSKLIGHEIDRIDSLVNQLLRFARPAKPVLQPMHVHEILDKSLQLIGHRLYQKDIKLTRLWGAGVDTIRADADQLEQVFLNFLLNAMDAMKGNGQLTVATEIRPTYEWATSISSANGEAHEALRITIRDNGEGIRSEDLPHVFDPFFTTKDYGTGLGLSVVHAIVQEHGGQIEVESELAKGTAFHIMLPLVRFNEEVAAA